MSTQFTNRQWRLPNNENKNKQSNYSMDFDSASSDYISGNINTPSTFTNLTVSCWVNVDSFSAIQNGILSSSTSSGQHDYENGFALEVRNDNKFRFKVSSGGSTTNWLVASDTSSTNQWYHIACVVTPTQLELFVNGVSKGTESNSSLTPSFERFFIGSRFYSSSPANYFDGQLDAVSIFNYALSSSQITTLYGSSSTGIGNPMSLSPKPVAYYPLGDQDAFNGADYLVPNIAAEEADGDIAVSYSPYALEFDGTNDYITLDSLQTFNNEFSVSVWLNPDDNTEVNLLGNSSTITNFLYINSSNQLQINSPNFSPQIFSNTTLSIGSWQHVILTRDSNNIFRAYKNGDLLDTSSAASGAFSFNQIGRYGAVSTYIFNGKLSNYSIWNTALTSTQVSEIYNEGVPSNLNNHSAYSNLVSWWQLGSNTSWVDPYWIALDEKGTNNGQSQNVAAPNNMGESAIVDGVGSYANGLSSGMGGDEVIGSAPFSDANSLSINMDVLDRTEDTPS